VLLVCYEDFVNLHESPKALLHFTMSLELSQDHDYFESGIETPHSCFS
jgi:hypothetical protein